MSILNLEKFKKYKFVFFGNSSVGKTSAIYRYLQIPLEEVVPSFGGSLFYIRTQSILNESILILIWDISGNPKYHLLAPFYFKQAFIIFLFFDITCRKSFNDILKWIPKIRISNPDCLIYLVGNKSDLFNTRLVSYKCAYQFSLMNSLIYHEISSFSGNGIIEMFNLAFSSLY